jgi:hypothetical protein
MNFKAARTGSPGFRYRRRLRLDGARRFCCLLAILVCSTAAAYEGRAHQQLTFIAAMQFNRCVSELDIPRLTALQVRYVARAEWRFSRKVARWPYYGGRDEGRKRLLWFIQTRLHEHFDSAVAKLAVADDLSSKYANLGVIVNLIQDMTSPAHVVPVFTTRWWRFSFADRFNTYDVDERAVEEAIGDYCMPLEGSDETFAAVLHGTAEDTRAAVAAPMLGMPATWEALWRFGDPGDFGEYGNAGNNFGRPTRFDCGDAERCVLLKDDPLYAAFALDRHLVAVRATMAAMLLAQREAP